MELFELIAAAALGIALSASAGLRAFLPLLVTGIAARLYRPELLGDSFQWLQETPALIALSVAVVAELLADKIPAVDHALDAVQGPVRTGAGVLACLAVGGAHLPGWATALLAIVGGSVALGTHSAKSLIRVGSSATTGGLANPLVSLFEDLLALLVSVLSVLAAILACVFALLALGTLWVLARRIWRWLTRRRAAPVAAAAPPPELSA